MYKKNYKLNYNIAYLNNNYKLSYNIKFLIILEINDVKFYYGFYMIKNIYFS